MAALFARLWLSRSVTDPVGLTVAKPFSLPTRRSRTVRCKCHERSHILTIPVRSPSRSSEGCDWPGSATAFSTGFKGAPSARQAWRPEPRSASRREQPRE